MTETQSTEEIEVLASRYNMYGNRQDEFGHLPAESQAEVVEYCHALANLENYARGLEVVTVMPSGTVITRAELDREMAAVRGFRPTAAVPVSTHLMAAAGLLDSSWL